MTFRRLRFLRLRFLRLRFLRLRFLRLRFLRLRFLRLLFLVLAALLSACASYAVPLPALDGAEPAPNLTLPTPNGGTLALSDLRGKVVFVNFSGALALTPSGLGHAPSRRTTYHSDARRRFR